MKPKQLIPLIVVVLVLGGLVALRQSQRTPAGLDEQYELTPLVPEGLEAESLDRIEFYPGGNEEAKQVLARSGDGWVVATHYDAPVLETKIDEFLDTLIHLSGEFRASAGEDGLSAYKLEDETGFHVVGYTEGSDTPVFHVVSGKSPDFEQAFARAADGSDVYVIASSLRREVGIYTVEMDDAPEPDPWLDKSVVNVESSAIKQVALTYPDKALTFELRQEEPETEASAEAEEEDEETPGETILEWNWAVAKGGPAGMDFNSNAVTNLTRRVARLRATDIVDPATKAEWDLESPRYRAELTVDGEDAPIVLEVGRPADDTSVYVRRADREADLVYKVSGYEFEQIFQKGGEFFELPGILVEEASVDSIEYALDGRPAGLARDGEEWNVVTPNADVLANPDTVDDLVRAALAWKAEDYADPGTDTGLDGAADRITIAGPEVQHSIVVGNVAPTEGRYARLDGGDLNLVMSEADVASIFAGYGDLFEADLFDLSAGDVSSVSLTWGGVVAKADRTEDGWSITLDDQSAEANAEAIDDLVEAIVSLEAEDFIFDAGRTPGATIATVTLTTGDGADRTIAIEAQDDGTHAVTKTGVEAVYLVDAEAIADVLVESASLTVAPAEQDADVPAEDTDTAPEADSESSDDSAESPE